jgi:uncharacterized RDD family membrane protein YckC
MKATNFFEILCILAIVWIAGALFLVLAANSGGLPWLEFGFRIYSLFCAGFFIFGVLKGWLQ